MKCKFCKSKKGKSGGYMLSIWVCEKCGKVTTMTFDQTIKAMKEE